MHAFLRQKGFSLLEILAVVVIISITVTFATITFGDFGSTRRTLIAAEHFVSFMNLLEQQAILQNQTFGIKIVNNSYQAMRFTSQDKWQKIGEDKIFRQRHFPDNNTLTINSSTNPQIIVQSSGDYKPFQLQIREKNGKLIATIIASINGKVTIQKAPS